MFLGRWGVMFAARVKGRRLDGRLCSKERGGFMSDDIQSPPKACHLAMTVRQDRTSPSPSWVGGMRDATAVLVATSEAPPAGGV